MTLVAILIIIGLILLVIEFFLIPGISVAGIGGFFLIVFGIFTAYRHGTTEGNLTLIFTAVASIVTLALSLRAKTWRRVTLNDSINSKASDEYEKIIKPGDEGVTISRLAPMGKAIINNNVVEVTSVGELIDQKTTIEVLKVEANKIIVKPKK